MYRNILLVMTGNVASCLSATEHAESLSVQFRARLTILAVIEPVSYFVCAGGIGGVGIPSFEAEDTAAAERILRATASSIAIGVALDTRLRRGHTAREIKAQVRENGHDLVVISGSGPRRLIGDLRGRIRGPRHSRLDVPLLVVEQPSAETLHAGRIALRSR